MVNTKQKLDLDTWNRKEHFLFFKQMDEPFFGLTATIDCTKAYMNAKALNVPFYTYYLHKTIAAVNTIGSFRYRIINDEVWIFDSIHVSATVIRDDNSFGFSLIEYTPKLSNFRQNVDLEVARVKRTPGLFTTEFSAENVIHFSALPWVDFTALSHARSYILPDSCPKISVGKMTEKNEKKTMPMSIHVHHGLMDGYHVGLFLDCFQKLMNFDEN